MISCARRRTVHLDEAARKFYIVTPNQLYVADVPEAATPAHKTDTWAWNQTHTGAVS